MTSGKGQAVRTLIAASTLLLVNFVAWNRPTEGAELAPKMGFLYNTKETGSLTYSCELDSAKALHCEFVQVAVRKKAKPSDLDETIRKAREEYRSGTVLSGGCETAKQFSDVLDGRVPAPKPEYIAKLTAVERRDLAATIGATLKFCSPKSEDAYLVLTRQLHNREERTCVIASHTFRQTFQLVDDQASGKNVWVTKSAPDGACGVVQLSRFEPVVTPNYIYLLELLCQKGDHESESDVGKFRHRVRTC